MAINGFLPVWLLSPLKPSATTMVDVVDRTCWNIRLLSAEGKICSIGSGMVEGMKRGKGILKVGMGLLAWNWRLKLWWGVLVRQAARPGVGKFIGDRWDVG